MLMNKVQDCIKEETRSQDSSVNSVGCFYVNCPLRSRERESGKDICIRMEMVRDKMVKKTEMWSK